MIYLSIKGRLGNQLFQYAFARYIQMERKDDLTIIWSKVNNRHTDEGDGWENSLNHFNIINCNNVDNVHLSNLQKKLLKGYGMLKYNKYTIKYPIIYKTYGKVIHKFGVFMYPEKYTKDFTKAKNLLAEDIFIEGYYESSKYFNLIDNIIKKEFTPKYEPLKKNERLYNIINNTNSICVSIRRGDFFSEENVKKFGVYNIEYFYKGIDYIRKIYSDSTVIIFSDDIAWVKNEMKFPSRVFYEDGTDPLWEKLRLMYSCKHFVISNSTFSWWAQHLSRHSNKIVVAPKVWKTTDKIYDIKEENWVLLD